MGQQLPGSEKLNWPNAVTGLDASIFGFPDMSIGSGFLVPSHTTGGVWILEASTEPKHIQSPVKITKDKFDLKPDSGWFYHLAVPIDMNGTDAGIFFDCLALEQQARGALVAG